MAVPKTHPAPASAPSTGWSEEALQQRVADLTEAVAARDAFIAVAAHELRNPMTPILGQIELLLSAVRAGRCSPAQVEQRLERIEYAVRHYLQRATTLLNVSRITSGQFRLKLEPLDLARRLRDVAGTFAEAAEHAGVPITVSAPDNLPGIWDGLALEQIIDNLVSNALKYGGRTPVELSLDACEKRVRLQVRDHGSGIAPNDRERVFQRFEQAVGHGDQGSGFGIGLWVVGQLAEAMGGRVVVDDAPGGGALFTVTLPRQVKEPSA